MSEETPRLSRREMREQGLLKAGQEEVSALRGDLQTRTSELQLRRPSRREMRLQREANEAKVAEQSAKFADATATEEKKTHKDSGSQSVHSFDFSGAKSNASSVPVQATPSAPAESKAPSVEPAKSVEPEKKASPAPEASVPEVKKEEKSDASSERSSVFNRFAPKENAAASFRDRLVARTREGQREARENQPVLSAFPDVAQKKRDDTATQIDEMPAQKAVEATGSRIEENFATSFAAATKLAPAPVSASTPEDDGKDFETTVSESVTAPKENKVKGKANQAKITKIISDDDRTQGESSRTVSVAEDTRYPTDVSMRLEDDDEKKTGVERLVSLLIILVGILGGVIIGLLVRNFVFGAHGFDVHPVPYVQAVAADYGNDSSTLPM